MCLQLTEIIVILYPSKTYYSENVLLKFINLQHQERPFTPTKWVITLNFFKTWKVVIPLVIEVVNCILLIKTKCNKILLTSKGPFGKKRVHRSKQRLMDASKENRQILRNRGVTYLDWRTRCLSGCEWSSSEAEIPHWMMTCPLQTSRAKREMAVKAADSPKKHKLKVVRTTNYCPYFSTKKRHS